MTFNATSLRIAGLAASILLSLAANAQPVFDTPANGFKGKVVARSANPVPGSSAEIIGSRFVPGQRVDLLRGQTVLTSAPITVDADGQFKTELTIPADAVPGQHPLVVRASNPAAAAVATLRVSPALPLSGQSRFDVVSQPLVRGLYQSDYSAASNALFVTAAVGRPPVTESRLVKVDPQTLQVIKAVTPAQVPGGRGGSVYAVYGIGVDDAHGTVWVTNTRQNSVAVYRQADLSLVRQFAVDAVPHARDVVVDSQRGRAYVSATGEDFVAVFDTATLTQLEPITLASGVDDGQFSPMSLALDAGSGKVYTVSMSTGELAVIDGAAGKVEKIIALPSAQGASGVAFDAARNRVLVASQSSDNLLIVDLASGRVLHDVPVGAGALNVAFEPLTGLAYVSNRGAGTVAVVDGEGRVVANLAGGTFPNHVRADGKGGVFAVNKSQGADDPHGDHLARITPHSP
ncbi:YncE family protein [Stenotrophomonas sp. C3(2023)]|uniref:YncE family protein n=1 Tax=Stenotrophomonas sp. C3(2023) TaxID=3080277 RepID=UPI00293C45CA|nr:YncE family protein [Stenotrophomonas sp. C3(2023)]MDV3468735.1 YncE family protein [Stenotrophomonas sp. C3(2023)]